MQPCDAAGNPLNLYDLNYNYEPNALYVVGEPLYAVEPYGPTDDGEVGSKRTLLFAGGEVVRIRDFQRLFRRAEVTTLPLVAAQLDGDTDYAVTGKRLDTINHVRFTYRKTDGTDGGTRYLWPKAGTVTDTAMTLTHTSDTGVTTDVAAITSITVNCKNGDQAWPAPADPPRRAIYKANGDVAYTSTVPLTREAVKDYQVLNNAPVYTREPYSRTDRTHEGAGGKLTLLFKGNETLSWFEMRSHFPHADIGSRTAPPRANGDAFVEGDSITLTGERLSLISDFSVIGKDVNGNNLELIFTEVGVGTDTERTFSIHPVQVGSASSVPWKFVARDNNGWRYDVTGPAVARF